MAYVGASTPQTGTTSSGTLSRDVYVDTLEHFGRSLVFMQYLNTQTIENGTGAQFIVEGKEDTADGHIAAYTAGAQVTVTAGTQDQRIINLDRPQHEARRIDKFDEKTQKYDVIAMQVRQISQNLAAKVDRKCAAAIEAASLATGLAGQGNGTVVVNTALPGGAAAAATPAGLGDEICESIFAAKAAIELNDVSDDVYVALNPTNYAYVVQSGKAVNADYSMGNGSFAGGTVMEVGGVRIVKTNNLPTTAGLIGLAFTANSAGLVKLWDVESSVTTQPDFLDAKLIVASFSNGVGTLSPQCAVSIKNV